MEGVYVGIEAAVATIMIDRQDDENRLTRESLLRLKSIVGELGDRDDVHAVVVRGRGSGFSARECSIRRCAAACQRTTCSDWSSWQVLSSMRSTLFRRW